MSLQIGIVGLPNVGKSTLFNALTQAGAATAPYPYTTIDPNIGVAAVPDPRLDQLVALVRPEKVSPATVEFVDIAGLVKGASHGEGLGNQFLGHIRNVDAVLLVLHGFEDPDVPTAGEQVDPLVDLETLETELILADLAAVDRRIEKVQGQAKAHPRDFTEQLAWLARLRGHLNNPRSVVTFPEPAHHADWTADFPLLSGKPRLYVVNVGENSLPTGDPLAAPVRARAHAEGAPCLALCAACEAELISWPPDEAAEYRKDLGLSRAGPPPAHPRELPPAQPHHLLHDRRRQGEPCLEPPSRPDSLRGCGQGALRHPARFHPGGGGAPARVDRSRRRGQRSQGHVRLEGKEYIVQDGDVIAFRFSV